MEELRSYWQLPSIAHYCNLFRDSFKLPNFDDEELEFAFLSKTSNDLDAHLVNGNSNNQESEGNLLRQIIIVLLRGYFKGHNISVSNWEHYLVKLFNIRWVDSEGFKSPFTKVEGKNSNISETVIPFDDLPLFVKVDVVYHLCEYRLYPEDAQNAANLLDSDDLRLEPLGKDSEGNLYWYFKGTRLYRENPTVAKRINTKLSEFEKRKKLSEKRGEQCPEKSQVPERKEGERKLIARSCRNKNKSTINGSLTNDCFDESVSCGIPLSELKEGWHPVCVTSEDWKNFELKLSASTDSCEIELYKLLSDGIFKKVSDLFAAKEREARKKLIEFLPRRGSSRLEAKKLQREQEEKRLQEEVSERKRHRGEAESRAKMDEERNKQKQMKEERERRAKQRLAIIEATAMKYQDPELETRNENETEEFSSESNSSDVYNGNSQEEVYNNYQTNGWPIIDVSKSQLTATQLYEGLPKVISTVMSNRDAWPFKEAVDEKTAPLYYQVIEEPIDLSIIEEKINQRVYTDLIEVEKDFKLMVNNCETYNGPRNGYTLMAYACWKAFKKSVKKYLNTSLSQDEKSVFIYPPRVTNNNTTAAIEARKRKRKHRKGMKALEMLAQAAEMAVKDTSSRSSSVGVVDEKSSDIEDDKEPLTAFKVHGNALARYVYTQNTASVTTTSIPDANLTFKSLSEWSESLKQSGNSVILPHDTVVITTSPITSTWVTNGPLTTCVASTREKRKDTCDHSVIEHDNTHETMSVSNNERLVLKLSKYSEGGTTLWQLRNTDLVSTHEHNSPPTTTTAVFSALKEQSSFNFMNTNNSGFKHLSNSCIPVKKRLYIPPSDSECENNDESFSQMNLNQETEDKSDVHEPMPVIKSMSNNQVTQRFQITGFHTSKNSSIKVLRLKRIPNESHSLCVPPPLQEAKMTSSSTSLNVEQKDADTVSADGYCVSN